MLFAKKKKKKKIQKYHIFIDIFLIKRCCFSISFPLCTHYNYIIYWLISKWFSSFWRAFQLYSNASLFVVLSVSNFKINSENRYELCYRNLYDCTREIIKQLNPEFVLFGDQLYCVAPTPSVSGNGVDWSKSITCRISRVVF